MSKKTKKNDPKKAIFEKLKKANPRELDQYFSEENEEVFSNFDCLSCANCCKTTGPLFTQADISRISKYVGMKEGSFVESYLQIDEDEDYVLKKLPCAFLGEDNRCSIYDVRPKACREYPHTHQKRQHEILRLTKINYSICPAAEQIVQRVFSRLQ